MENKARQLLSRRHVVVSSSSPPPREDMQEEMLSRVDSVETYESLENILREMIERNTTVAQNSAMFYACCASRRPLLPESRNLTLAPSSKDGVFCH